MHLDQQSSTKHCKLSGAFKKAWVETEEKKPWENCTDNTSLMQSLHFSRIFFILSVSVITFTCQDGVKQF